MKDQKTVKPRIPSVLLHEYAENKIFNAVNEAAHQIPFYQIEGILTNILHQVREHAKAEREAAARSYAKQLEEYNKEQEAKKERVKRKKCKEQ